MEKEEDSKIDFLRSLYNREDFEIRSIRKSDGKEFVVIRSYTVRKEDFEDVKEIQDFLEVDGVIFLMRIKFNENWQGKEAKEYLKKLFGLKEIIFEEIEAENKKNFLDKIEKFLKNKIRI
ncbi:MAG: hypothetical protein ACPLXS_01245 [Candidatus Micrarchaeales archaeon]